MSISKQTQLRFRTRFASPIRILLPLPLSPCLPISLSSCPLVPLSLLLLVSLSLLLLVSISHAFQPSVEATRSPGAESFQTDLFTGRLSTAVPIAVPPGRGNLQPRLALAYQSGGGNGWCGVGWTLDLGSIQRSPKNGVPTYNDTLDTFTATLNGVGAELVAIGGGEYRAQIEAAFMKFQYTGGYWRVLDKRGTEYLFGSSANSQMNTTNGTFRWYLDRVTDVHGNTMTLTYFHDQGEVYLGRIAYTDGFYTVDFQLNVGERPDISTSLLSGEKVVTAHLLHAVEIRAGGALVRRYELGYVESPATGRSLLNSVTQYGNDGVTTLPAMTFTYYADVGRPSQEQNGTSHYFGYLPFAGCFRGRGLDIGLYEQTVDDKKGWIILERKKPDGGQYAGSFCEFDPDTTPQPADFNGDGLTDAGVHKDAGEWIVALTRWDESKSCWFDDPQSWHPGFGGGQKPIGGDFNGDGLADVGTFNESSGEWLIALSNGTRFVGPTTWASGFGSGAKPLTGDFNGDGLTDAGAFYDNGRWDVALSNGSGFLSDGTWLTGFGANQMPFSGDFNVDGRTDVGVYNQGTWQIAISRGDDFFIFDTAWLNGFGGEGWSPFAGNFDNSGRTVAGIYNHTTGKPESGSWKLTVFAPDTQPPDYLVEIHNGVGGVTQARYVPYDPTINATFLPFPVLVVSETTATDTVTGLSVTTRYDYHSCLYDGESREFRGFARAQMIDHAGNVTETWFHQDEVFKGKPQVIQQRDRAGNIYTETQNQWNQKTPNPSVSFPFLAQADQFTYDGDTSFKQTRTRWEYDDYGNVMAVQSDGDVATAADDRRTVTTYAPFNLNAWLIGLPQRTQTVNEVGALVAQRTFYYDDSESTGTIPTKGDLTMVEDWLNTAPSNPPRTRLKYDPYGNLIQTTDANGNITKTTYDETLNLYLSTIENALGHQQKLTSDLKTGQVLTKTDPNDRTTENRYDAFGRLIAVIGPLDSETHPSVTYDYDLTSRPTRTTTRKREQYGTDPVLESITYFDGFGRPLQTRTEAEDPGLQIVAQAVTYNFRGQAAEQWLPYFVTKNSPYAPPNPADPKTTFEYDPIGRLIRTVNPDYTDRLTEYNDWAVTNLDENGNQTVYINDAYGRLREVQEYNEGEVYYTTYQYDALDNLTGTEDHEDNTTFMAYDSLKRKIFMNDPDMGFWQYVYDSVGNLRFQTDAKGQRIEFRYDKLNRLEEKYYPGDTIPDVTYTYDNPDVPNGIGRLSSIVDISGETRFEYDAVGREVCTVRRIDGTDYEVKRTYDAMDRLTHLTYPDGDAVTYTYNAAGQIEHVAGAQTYLQNMDYSATGQPTRLQYGNGVRTDYTYNALTLRLKTLTSTREAQQAARGAQQSGLLQQFEYHYDNVGNISDITDAVNTATQAFQYDDLYRLTDASGSYGEIDCTYDSIGNRIECVHNSISGPTQVLQTRRIGYRYGEARRGGPHAVTSTSDGVEMTYDENGNMIQKGSATYRYDDENRLVEANVPLQGPQEITLQLQPGWNFLALPLIPDSLMLKDLLGSIDYEQVSRFNPNTQLFEHYLGEDPSKKRFNQFEDVEYGRGYQLYISNPASVTLTVKGQVPEVKPTVSLSPGWNLIACPSLTPIPVSDAFPNLTIGVDYDAVAGYNGTTYEMYTGNPDTDTLTTLHPGRAYFIHCLRVATWEPPTPTNRVQFVYDGDGGRVKKITPMATTLYLGELYEVTNGVATRHIFAGATRVASKDSNGGLYFYHPDHLGSANILTDRDGVQVQLWEYLPFGGTSRQEGDGTFTLGYQYTGQTLDAETELYFYGARYYDSVLGRFMTADPIGLALHLPQSLNRYAYGFNNPLRYVDPSGLWSIGFNFFGLFGFSIGDEGFSFTFAFVTLGYNWESNTASISLGIGFELGNFSIGASIGYAYNFNTGTGYAFASAGVSASLGGLSYNYGVSWNSATNEVGFGGDFSLYMGNLADYFKSGYNRVDSNNTDAFFAGIHTGEDNPDIVKARETGLGVAAYGQKGGVLAAAWELLWPWKTKVTNEAIRQLEAQGFQKGSQLGNVRTDSGGIYVVRKLLATGYIGGIENLVIERNSLLVPPASSRTWGRLNVQSVTIRPALKSATDPHWSLIWFPAGQQLPDLFR